MHSRNIYKVRPDFAALGRKYEFLAPFLTLDVKGLPKIDFKDRAALTALTRALLLDDFDLDVEIPEGVLVPTVPLRLNYILWLEDLLEGIPKRGDESVIRGLDVGTGATGVYALLAARKNGWRMTGTEVDSENVEFARKNVEKNKLEKLVEIVPTVKGGDVISPVLQGVEDFYFSFTMCNPPFFGSEDETDSVMKGRFSSGNEPLRPPPSAAKTGKGTELVAEGGELQFIERMINESLLWKDKVMIFSTMVGIKRHMKHLVNYLRSHHIANYTTTEFIQGKTMRWGLAWSFHLNLLPPKPDLVWTVPNFSPIMSFENLVYSYLQELKLRGLQWISSSDEVDEEHSGSVLEFLAIENTWTGQRRKRRMEMLKNQEMDVSPPKMSVMEGGHSKQSASSVQEDQPILMHAFIDFAREEGAAKLMMRFRDGTLGKEGLHQILQYVKNRFEKDLKNPETSLGQHMSSSTTSS